MKDKMTDKNTVKIKYMLFKSDRFDFTFFQFKVMI